MLTEEIEAIRKADDKIVYDKRICASIKSAAITNENADCILPACSMIDSSLYFSSS